MLGHDVLLLLAVGMGKIVVSMWRIPVQMRRRIPLLLGYTLLRKKGVRKPSRVYIIL